MKKFNSVSVVGTQWGDEGKGKVTNYLSQQADFVVRYQGGNNAGHSIKINEKKYALHLIPSGIFEKNVINVIANGVVIDPIGLKQELTELNKKGIKKYKLKISDRAHIVFPYHILIDALQEKIRDTRNIGTTMRGIGPCYVDKVDRSGIRVIDLYDNNLLKKLISNNVQFKNIIIKHLMEKGVNIKDEYEKALNKVKIKSEVSYKKLANIFLSDYKLNEKYLYKLALEYRDFLKPYVTDTSILIYDALKKGKKVLFEGAQGVLLSLEHGTYPFVTSSEPTSSSISVGVGLPNWMVDNKSLGVVKAYSTRIGTGSFPTEFKSKIANKIRQQGNEFGTTTGRPRRIGWFDAILVRHAARVSGLTHISVTLLDVLTGIKKLKIATKYIINNKETLNIPAGEKEFNNVKPIYIELDGWDENITKVKSFNELPKNAKKYLKAIEKNTGIKIAQFSVGPERSQTIDIIKMFE